MLPPLRFAADPTAPVSADPTGMAGLPAPAGRFGAALSELVGHCAAAGSPLATLPRASAAGQPLPQSGKALPPAAAGTAATPPAAGIRRARQAAIDLVLERMDATVGGPADLPPLPGTPAFPLPPAPGSDAPVAAVGSGRPAPLSVPATPLAKGVVLPVERTLAQQRPGGPQTLLPGEALQAQPAAPGQTAAAHQQAANSAGPSAAPALPSTPPTAMAPAALFLTEAVAAATRSQAASRLPADTREPKGAPVAATSPSPLASLAGAAPPPASPPAASIPGVPDIAQAPGSAGWGDALSERVLFMAGHKIQNAEIRLHPAELGPLRVQISIDDGTATVHFHAHHALTRDAIEQAMPRLREMLVEQGLTPGHTSVSDQGASRHPQDPGGRHAGGTASALPFAEAALEGEDTRLPTARSVAPAGLVDLFA